MPTNREAQVDLGALAETITSAVLRAVSSRADLQKHLGPDGSGVIIRPDIRAGGWIMLGNAARSFNMSEHS